jgi:abortive infection bacteriophage resistance protein
MTTYNKPALDVPAQLAQWQERGLTVADVSRAQHYLAVVGYYRLSAYSLPFQVGNPDHNFIPNTRFDDILDLYVFDRELVTCGMCI